METSGAQVAPRHTHTPSRQGRRPLSTFLPLTNLPGPSSGRGRQTWWPTAESQAGVQGSPRQSGAFEEAWEVQHSSISPWHVSVPPFVLPLSLTEASRETWELSKAGPLVRLLQLRKSTPNLDSGKKRMDGSNLWNSANVDHVSNTPPHPQPEHRSGHSSTHSSTQHLLIPARIVLEAGDTE
ncbi:unnamed protein product [Gulo gulo]|uniref:Uncharacterized protein n=1 Tax=Gulo gulo TaxID=48420 RepID=A0A9X9M212_GULGU|nr:unnamed protein product [Gulo gulo]